MVTRIVSNSGKRKGKPFRINAGCGQLLWQPTGPNRGKQKGASSNGYYGRGQGTSPFRISNLAELERGVGGGIT
jgi:hypothetical protein